MKRLIVNADDLGYAQGINEGIIKAYREGIVTSTSLMVKGKAARDGARLATTHPKLGLGLHFQIEDFDWNFLWQLKKVVAAIFIERTKKEFINQVEIFKKLTGKTPDHIDGHHHVHRMPRIYQLIRSFCQKNKIPMRGQTNLISSFFQYPNAHLTIRGLIKTLRNLPEGTSEIMCHPGFVSSDLKSFYRDEREIELQILTSPRIRQEIQRLQIKLISWKDV